MPVESDVITKARQKERELLEVYEQSRIKADMSVAVPTIDADVKRKLRSLGQPICLFGEGPFERRERLKLLVGRGHLQQQEVVKKVEKVEMKKEDEVFYTHGSPELMSMRKRVAAVSLAAAQARLEEERARIGSELSHGVGECPISNFWDSREVFSKSQIGDVRPLTSIAISPDSAQVAVAGWSGDVNVFSINTMTQTASLRGHEERCCAVVWGSESTLASCGVDRTVRVWSTTSRLIPTDDNDNVIGPSVSLEGHELRVNRIAFHPHVSELLASTSDDETWRLWDIEHQQELLLQEGHVSAVFAVGFHPDGSLVGTTDTAGVVRVWDVRSGRSVMGLENQHVEQILGIDFSPNGVSFATCSGDNSVRIWDLRKRACVDVLAAHEKLVSAVKFNRTDGSTLMSAGYDCVARVWRTRDFKVIKNLPIHESRIMAADLSGDGKTVATACYDRTFKIWSRHQAKIDADVKMESTAD